MTRYSRLDRKIILLIIFQYLTAFNSHIFVGCFVGNIWTRVRYFVICLRSSSSIGRNSVSYYNTVVDVVLRHPIIVFMAKRYTDVRLLTWMIAGEFRVSSGLCQIAAPYWILGLITAVYSLLIYLNGVLQMILAMLDSVKANLMPFLVA